MGRYRNPATGVVINIPDDKLAKNPGYQPADDQGGEKPAPKPDHRPRRAASQASDTDE